MHAAASGVGAALDAGALEYEFPCLVPFDATDAPSFAAIFHGLFCRSGCANIYCHGSRGANAGLSFETVRIAYDALVGVSAGADSACGTSQLRRVQPGDPERSLLLHKLAGTHPCGQRMPPEGQGYANATEAQLAQMRAWIAAGAARD